MGFFGGNSSSSGTLSNVISYSPNLTIGEGNEAKQSTSLDQRASAEALAKDSMSASVGVGVGGGSGSGGAVSATEDNSRGVNPVMSGVTQKPPSPFATSNKTLYFAFGGIALSGVVMAYILNRKKKK